MYDFSYKVFYRIKRLKFVFNRTQEHHTISAATTHIHSLGTQMIGLTGKFISSYAFCQYL